MQRAELEELIRWSAAYNKGWDNTPGAYADNELVAWGRTRRLARLAVQPVAALPGFKSYLGVQHVDPSRGGWNSLAEPQARFFVSWFVGRQTLGLRTFPTMAQALDQLWQAYQIYQTRLQQHLASEEANN